jgi:hypothetical protein
MNLPPMTQNQKLVLSFLASTAAGAVSAVIAAVVQSYTQQGLDIPVLVNVALIAFGAFFGPALYNFVPGHIQQIMQAYSDTAAMYRSTAQQTQQQHAALTQTAQALSQTVQAQAVALVQATPPAQPLQGSAQPLAPATNINWMLDKPAVQQPAPLQGASVAQVPFPPVRPVPSPQSMPVVRPPLETVNMAQTPVDVSQQQTAYQSAALPPDLHFGDSQIMPTVGQ